MEAFLSRRKKSLYWYLLGTLVAVELLMSFSFLGYIHVEPISITLAYIPVLLTGALMGPLESTFLGAVFGLASMWKASASYVMALDQLFSPTMSGHPLESVLLSVGSRMLFGLLIGLLYMAARHGRFAGLWIGLVSFFGRTLHAVLVYAALWAFFPEAGYTPVDALSDFMSFNGLLTSAVSTALVLLCWYVSRSQAWQQFQRRLEAVHSLQLGERYHSLSLVAIIAVTLGAAVAVAFYFVHRMESVLAQTGTPLSETGYADLLHLQIQFLIGILSMMALVIIFLVFNRRYNTYKDREAKIDSLTGALNRRAFFQTCTRALRSCSAAEDASCYFLMVDLDFSKPLMTHTATREGTGR